ncbi:SGNH/GDSL hydrolase family protein [Candidatus Dactylopiibacterium carminicum]|uniref:SGNH/GDSL hydrolase family protein n=1 Tax=Candidatus Dactylopiibacterium carminicum TaxID=857335 RepID=UPI00164996A9|nr:SGNH/GDSL hydrolase family protein [Candidatus Dactylopiibacterium carminicum]
MKKWSRLLSALVLGLSLSACGGGSSDGDSGSSSSSPSSSSASSSTSSSSSTGSQTSLTLHMLGDSTMTTYTEDRRPQMGWGEATQQFFDSSVKVQNWALGGRSSRSFYKEASRWPTILPQIASGDYVIIQFGHNDQKYGSDYAEYGTYAYCSDGSGDGEACTGATDTVDTTVDKSEHS